MWQLLHESENRVSKKVQRGKKCTMHEEAKVIYVLVGVVGTTSKKFEFGRFLSTFMLEMLRNLFVAHNAIGGLSIDPFPFIDTEPQRKLSPFNHHNFLALRIQPYSNST